MIIGKAISPFVLRKKGSAAATFDSDAQAFITATGITGTNATATNQLVLDLKAANIWTKMKAVYPMVGGTATTHKFNLVNSQDSDAAFRLVFTGGWTHSSTGSLPNGTNAYASTFLTTSVNLALNSGHYSTYLRTNNTTAAIDIGSQTNSGSYTYLYTYYTSPTLRDYRYCEGFSGVTRLLSPARTDGHFITSRTGASAIKGYRNGAVEVSATTASSATSNVQIIIGALNNNGTAQNFSNRQCAFASIGDGLTDAEALALYNATQTFNTTLGRQV